MPIFGANPGFSQNLPIDKVKSMRAQGLDNNQIIQTLQRDGYPSGDIFDALNQADMASASPSGFQQSQNRDYSQNISTQSVPSQENFGFSGSDDNFQHNMSPPPSNSGMMPPPSGDYSQGDVSNEELVEAIIDEKWNELMKDINKVVEWKNSMNIKITGLEQKFDSLKSEFDKIHNAILGKIDDYDKNLSNVGAEVKAMEKVFSKVLPVFTENVSELSKIAKEFRSNKTSKK
ncbi:hypothetical protein K9L97_06015 [Candidatus Woesearchaeota archaeon]|nr:hypothetical protein [Candidatus Woesearchaeota archaeon]